MTDSPHSSESHTSASTSTVPVFRAGWYSDGVDPRQRYWNGLRWTDHYAPAVHLAPANHENGFGTAALVFGVIALLFGILPVLSFLAWLPATFAIGLGIGGLIAKNRPRPKAVAGVILGVLAIIVGIVMVVASMAGSASSENLPTTFDSEFSDEPAGDVSALDEPETDPYDDAYGSFDEVTESGTGDDVIELPADAIAGLVTATHQGSDVFVLSVLDDTNRSTGDVLVDTIGNYSGVTAYGFRSFEEDVEAIRVSADGAWSITISPISSAAELTFPLTSTGDDVYLYNGDAAVWKFTNAGDSDFIVAQYSGDAEPNLAIDAFGVYSGSVPMYSGPSVVLVSSNGAWSVTD